MTWGHPLGLTTLHAAPAVHPISAARSRLRIHHGPLAQAALRVALLVVVVCTALPAWAQAEPAGGEWREFQGTWTAVGRRPVIPLDGDRRASIADFNGSLLLTGPARPAVGFRAEAIVLNDSVTGAVGRAVWTDERGDQLFSKLRGEPTAAGNRLFGTFLGPSLHYAGATSPY